MLYYFLNELRKGKHPRRIIAEALGMSPIDYKIASRLSDIILDICTLITIIFMVQYMFMLSNYNTCLGLLGYHDTMPYIIVSINNTNDTLTIGSMELLLNVSYNKAYERINNVSDVRLLCAWNQTRDN